MTYTFLGRKGLDILARFEGSWVAHLSDGSYAPMELLKDERSGKFPFAEHHKAKGRKAQARERQAAYGNRSRG